VLFYSEIFGGGRSNSNNNSGGQLVIIEMVVLLVSVVVYFVSFLLTMALSRYRELAADRSGAILIGQPSLLASALVKISGEMGRIPTKDLRAAEPFNAFFFVPAVAGQAQDQGRGQGGGGGFSFAGLFRTHPTLERRLAQLDQIEHELGQAR
jgi:heat shock protein HtpX